ncbi:MAG: hypothetical protein GKR93_08485 [Gammaproteobacteria bacterium]|nr:hypothetical protein [Gammaproteobacteria bacterium]
MNSRRQNGVALVLVLWMLAILTVLVAGYSRVQRTETVLTANIVNASSAQALASAGISLTIRELLKPESEISFRTDGTVHSRMYRGQQIKIDVRAESGKIDLNIAQPELLLGLLESVGYSSEISQSTLNTILDWRDKDNLTRPDGAEEPEYQEYDYSAKNGVFNSVSELLLVKGMSLETYRLIAPVLTVHSNQAGIFPLSASRETLLAIPNILESDIDDYIEQRSSPDNDNEFPPVLDADGTYLATTKGNVFTIRSVASINNIISSVEAVISIEKTGKRPFTVLSWSEDKIPAQEQLDES